MKSFWRTLLEIFVGNPSPSTRRAELPARPLQRYSTTVLNSRESALRATTGGNVFALVESTGHKKWALMRCPCGCGETLALNLMRTHSPCWTVRLNIRGDVTVEPSIDATKCGAHFWLRNGIVVWAGPGGPI